MAPGGPIIGVMDWSAPVGNTEVLPRVASWELATLLAGGTGSEEAGRIWYAWWTARGRAWDVRGSTLWDLPAAGVAAAGRAWLGPGVRRDAQPTLRFWDSGAEYSDFDELDAIRPGDFLYIVHRSATDLSSRLFVGWQDRRAGEAMTIESPGWSRGTYWGWGSRGESLYVSAPGGDLRRRVASPELVCALPRYATEGEQGPAEPSPFHPRLHRSVGCLLQAGTAFVDAQIENYMLRVGSAEYASRSIADFIDEPPCSLALSATSTCLSPLETCSEEAVALYREFAPQCLRRTERLAGLLRDDPPAHSLGARLGGATRRRLLQVGAAIDSAAPVVRASFERARAAREAAADAEERRAAAAGRAAREADAAAAWAECMADCRRRSDAATCERVCSSR